MSELEQFTDEVLERLEAEPWLIAFVEDADEDLDAAQARYREAVEAARERLHTRGVAVYHRMQPRRGVQTTALDISEESS